MLLKVTWSLAFMTLTTYWRSVSTETIVFDLQGSHSTYPVGGSVQIESFPQQASSFISKSYSSSPSVQVYQFNSQPSALQNVAVLAAGAKGPEQNFYYETKSFQQQPAGSSYSYKTEYRYGSAGALSSPSISTYGVSQPAVEIVKQVPTEVEVVVGDQPQHGSYKYETILPASKFGASFAVKPAIDLLNDPFLTGTTSGTSDQVFPSLSDVGSGSGNQNSNTVTTDDTIKSSSAVKKSPSSSQKPKYQSHTEARFKPLLPNPPPSQSSPYVPWTSLRQYQKNTSGRLPDRSG